MKRKEKQTNRTFFIAAAAGAGAVALTMFAAYRSTVNRLVPTTTSAAASGQVYTYSAPQSVDVPVQNNGYDVQYCGLAKELNIKAGQSVKQGEILGKTSDTNQCEILQQPHLHLAVKQGDKWIDPLSIVDKQGE